MNTCTKCESPHAESEQQCLCSKVVSQKNNSKNGSNEIKKVTRFLGEARDLDVQIIFLQDYMKSHSQLSNNTGVKLLLDSLVSRRANSQTTVVNELEELRNSGVLEEIKNVSNQILAEQTNEPLDPQDVLEEAGDRISAKLDKFLSMDYCVHKEEDILGHHQMRIRAKWLRYTMEAFSPLYKKELSREIRIIKRFQDTLGEMHDCDVWSQCIPKFIARIETQQATKQKSKKRTENKEKTLSELLKFVKERRKNYYKDFVQALGCKNNTRHF